MVALTQENGKVLCLHVPSRHEYNGQVCDLQPHHDAPPRAREVLCHSREREDQLKP